MMGESECSICCEIEWINGVLARKGLSFVALEQMKPVPLLLYDSRLQTLIRNGWGFLHKK